MLYYPDNSILRAILQLVRIIDSLYCALLKLNEFGFGLNWSDLVNLCVFKITRFQGYLARKILPLNFIFSLSSSSSSSIHIYSNFQIFHSTKGIAWQLNDELKYTKPIKKAKYHLQYNYLPSIKCIQRYSAVYNHYYRRQNIHQPLLKYVDRTKHRSSDLQKWSSLFFFFFSWKIALSSTFVYIARGISCLLPRVRFKTFARAHLGHGWIKSLEI